MPQLPGLNERRLVTVLSVDLADSTGLVQGLDPEDNRDVMLQHFDMVQDAVTACGGAVISYTGDGALAVFGWPEASEHHADEACQAAWEITQSKSLRPYRAGVHSGLIATDELNMIVGPQVNVSGECVYLAAQLQKAAPAGAVLVSKPTRRLCQRRLRTEAFHPGKPFPEPVVRLLQSPADSPRTDLLWRFSGKMIGRDAELDSLSARLDDDGHPLICRAVIGEPGIGKSRLLAEIARQARLACRRVLVFEAANIGPAAAYECVRTLIMKERRGAPDELASALADEFLAHGGDADDLQTLLHVLTGQASGDVEKPSARMTDRRIAENLAMLLSAELTRIPTLLIVENLHEIDPESVTVLRHLAQRAAPGLMLALSGRPEAKRLAGTITGDVIEISPLSDAHTDELAQRLAIHLTGAERQRLVERSNGNPFVLEQLLQGLSQLRDGSQSYIPTTVESLIHARLDLLDPATRSIAQRLSLLGETVELDVAESVLDEANLAQSQALSNLLDLAFVSPPKDGRVRFRHDLIADACASTVQRGRRRTIHLTAINAIKTLRNDLTTYHPIIAHHAIAAGEDELALEHLWQAAQRARRLTASQSLMNLFRTAMACCERLGTASETRFVDFVLLSFETFHLQGHLDQIDPYLDRAAKAAERQGRVRQQCIAHCHKGISFWYQGQFQKGAELMEGTLALAKSLDHLPLTYAAQFTYAQQLHNLGRIDEAFALVRSLCDVLEGDPAQIRLGAMGLPAALARAHAGYYLLEAGRYGEAEAYIRDALGIAESGNDAYSIMLAQLSLGRCFILQRRDEEAVPCLEEALAIVDHHGFIPAGPNTAGLLCTALTRTGRADEAITIARTCAKQGQLSRTGSYEKHYYYCGAAEARIATGDRAGGLADLRIAQGIARTTRNPCIQIQSDVLLAHALEHSGKDSEGVAKLRANAQELAETHHLALPPDPPHPTPF